MNGNVDGSMDEWVGRRKEGRKEVQRNGWINELIKLFSWANFQALPS